MQKEYIKKINNKNGVIKMIQSIRFDTNKEEIEKIAKSIGSTVRYISNVGIYDPPIICDNCGRYCIRKDATILNIKGKERYACNNSKCVKKLLKEELIKLV
jgi:hypothetical protein